MTTISIPKYRTKELSKTAKSYIAIAGLVAGQLTLIYLLIPAGIYIWRLLTCNC